ncbi:hypothetical protein QYE76_039627 [Lolium multiflorum]|uniref:RING-type domain-containing protein n=1 Tax=Lolium multiflorum TaxID=4521 RepID=A0AAD8TBH6_LOLMU|nr:hypothetical protein QYE76_039627 [Lolium multiflorum]
MDSANDARRAEARAAGILRLLMGMAAGPGAMPGARGVMLVQHVLVGGDGTGDLFSGGVGGGVPPASKAAIAALREVRAEQEGDCAICLDAFDAGKEMPCGHRFHGECLDRWLGVHGSCPVCRFELPKPDPAAAEEQQQQNGDGGGERQAVLLSFLVMGAPPEAPQEEEQMEVEEPWNIRVEDVD